jgi:hypothetical protein
MFDEDKGALVGRQGISHGGYLRSRQYGVTAKRKPGPIGIDPIIWNAIHHYKYPVKRKLQCCFFWTGNAIKNNAPDYVTGANKLLKEHNLLLDVCPSVNKVSERTLPFNEMVNVSHEQELRNLAHKNHYHEGRIPVIFCRFMGPIGRDSDTNGYVVRLVNWLPFILINVDNNSADNITLLHEIGHASGCEHLNSDTNFMNYPPNRNGILRNQVIKLATSYFARNA